MEFINYSREPWRSNEVMERKKAIVNRLEEILGVGRHLEKVLDNNKRLGIFANGINSEGERIIVNFSLTNDFHNDVHSFRISVFARNREEAERLTEHMPEDAWKKRMIDKMLDSERGEVLYRLDKTTYDTAEGSSDSDSETQSLMAALLGKNNSDRPNDPEEYLANRFEIDEEGRKVSYNDNYSETVVDSKRAEMFIDGLTVQKIEVYLSGVLQQP